MSTSIDVARMIDHTLLRPEATEDDVRRLCDEAIAHEFATVCINPGWIDLAARRLGTGPVGVCTVVDFPLGAGQPDVRRDAARRAAEAGADELDVVVPVGRLRAHELDHVVDDLTAIVDAAAGRIVKVILETACLEDEDIDLGCELSARARAAFVKTSTGFGPGGATERVVRRMRLAVGDDMGVKASGGIRDAAAARAMIAAGASRLGTSASLTIMAGWDRQ